jgi:hypothetical protein
VPALTTARFPPRAQPFTGGHVGAPDEDGRVVKIFGPSGEDRPVDQIAHVRLFDAAVAQHLVGSGVERHDAVEDARVPRRIELQEEFLHRTRR